jgi:hypothetical protein
MNCVNCWDSLKPAHHNVAGNGERDGLKSAWMHQWAISSQAAERSVEGSTDRSWSLSETVKTHERATPHEGEDISWSAARAVEAELKRSAITLRAGQLASDQTYVALALRAWLFFDGTNSRANYLGTLSQLYFTLTLGDKPMFVAPCWYFPAGGGIYGLDATTAVFNNGYPSASSIMKLARPIILPVRQNFNVNAEWFTVGTTDARALLNSGATDDVKVIMFMIDGLQTRDVQ